MSLKATQELESWDLGLVEVSKTDLKDHQDKAKEHPWLTQIQDLLSDNNAVTYCQQQEAQSAAKEKTLQYSLGQFVRDEHLVTKSDGAI